MSIVRESKAAAAKYKYPCRVCGKRARAVWDKEFCSSCCYTKDMYDRAFAYIYQIKQTKKSDDACWFMPDGADKWFDYFGTSRLAPMLMWLLYTYQNYGLAEGYTLQHSCGNEECCNYRHMYDDFDKESGHLDEEMIKRIRVLVAYDHNGKFSVHNLAFKFKVSEDLISRILARNYELQPQTRQLMAGAASR